MTDPNNSGQKANRPHIDSVDNGNPAQNESVESATTAQNQSAEVVGPPQNVLGEIILLRRIPFSVMTLNSEEDTPVNTMDTAMTDMDLNEEVRTTADKQAKKKRDLGSSPVNDRSSKKAKLGEDVEMAEVVDKDDSLLVPQSVDTEGGGASQPAPKADTTEPTGAKPNDGDEEEDSLFVPENRDAEVDTTNPTEAASAKTNGTDAQEAHIKTAGADVSDDDADAEEAQAQQTSAEEKKASSNSETGQEKWDAMDPALQARVLEGLTERQAIGILSRYPGRFILKNVVPKKGEEVKDPPQQVVRWLCSSKSNTPAGCSTDIQANKRGPSSHFHKCHKGPKPGEAGQTAYGINQRDPKTAVKQCLHEGQDKCKSKKWDTFNGYHKHIEKKHYKDFFQPSPGEGQTKRELCRRAKLDPQGANAEWANWVPKRGSKKKEPAFDWSLSRPMNLKWATAILMKLVQAWIKKDRATRQTDEQSAKPSAKLSPELKKMIQSGAGDYIKELLPHAGAINAAIAKGLVEAIDVPGASDDEDDQDKDTDHDSEKEPEDNVEAEADVNAGRDDAMDLDGDDEANDGDDES